MKRAIAIIKPVHGAARSVLARIMPYLALGVVVLSLFVAAARLVLPTIIDYRAQAERWLGQSLHRPVSIRSIRADWRGWAPELHIQDVTLREGTGRSLIHFNEALVRFDLLASLRHLTLRPVRVIVSGARFSVIRHRDGKVTVRGLDTAGVTSTLPTDNAVADWLFSRARLELRDSEVLWRDRKRGQRPVRLTGVSIRLRNAGPRHQLDAEAELPADLGQRLRFALDATGDIVGGTWDGEIYLQTQGLNLAPWLAQNLPPWLTLDRGRAALELWSTWRNAKPLQVLGRASLADISAKLKGKPLPLRKMTADLRYRMDPRGWDVSLANVQFTTNVGAWGPTDLDMYVDRGGPNTPARILGHVGALRLEDALPLLWTAADLATRPELPPSLAQASGEVRNLTFMVKPDAPALEELTLRGQFASLTIPAAGSLPGVQGLSGHLLVRGSRGALELVDRPVALSLPDLFSHGLGVDGVEGTLRWHREPQAWIVSTDSLHLHNSDIDLRLNGSLRLSEAGDAPFLTLVGHYEKGVVARVGDYLPDRLMPKTTAWARQALVGGRIPSGDLLFHGSFADFPFDHGDGRFEVRSNVSDGILEYEPDWPRIEEIAAEVVFDGRSLRLHSPAAKVFDADILRADVGIDDLAQERHVLWGKGRVRTSGADGLRFLHHSPLNRELEGHLKGANVGGQVLVDLSLKVPLYHGGPHQVAGTIRFDGNPVGFGAIHLDQVKGDLRFTQDGLEADDAHARLLNLPVSLTVRTVAKGGEHLTRMRVEGAVTPDFLARRYLAITGADGKAHASQVLARLRGTTTWHAILDMPAAGKGGLAEPSLTVESDLKGMSVNLPAPLGKTAAQRRPLSVTTVLAGHGEQVVSFGYGDALTGILALAADGSRLKRGALYLGRASGGLPSTEGLSVYGDLDSFSASKWLDLLYRPAASTDAAKGAAEAGLPPAGPVRHVDLAADRFELMGQWIPNLRLQADQQQAGGWRAILKGKTLSGVLSIPAAGSGKPVVMTFARLALRHPGKGSEAADKDPRELPPIQFACEHLTFDNIALGSVTLATRPTAQGLHIESFKIGGTDFEASATGNWRYSHGKQISQFKIALHSPDLGKMLHALDYDRAALEGGDTQLSIDAVWKGSPSEFSLDRMNGVLNLKVTNGRLVSVSPGAAGRIFGLLSLQALPRRLKLDFSDLFKKGFTYDRIEGVFTIDNGDAYTNDLTMLSPAARIDIAGRVGLAAEDYDQVVTITPEVGTTLPIAGAIAAGPLGAAAAFLAQNLFKTQIDKAIKYQYLVTGSWDNPTIERLPEKKTQ